MAGPWTTDGPVGAPLPVAMQWHGPPFPPPAAHPQAPPAPAPVPDGDGPLRAVLEAVVIGPADTLGLRIAPGSPAEMDTAADRIFADVKRHRPEL